MLELKFSSYAHPYDEIVNLADLVEVCGSVGELTSRLTAAIGGKLIEWGIEFKTLMPDSVSDGRDEMGISDDGDYDWISDAAKLAWYVEHELSSWHEPHALFAKIRGEGWKWTNFDELNSWEDEYSQEYDGDAEEFGKNWLYETDGDLPDHLQPYFDYEAYGESLLEGYDQQEWGGMTYLFHR